MTAVVSTLDVAFDFEQNLEYSFRSSLSIGQRTSKHSAKEYVAHRSSELDFVYDDVYSYFNSTSKIMNFAENIISQDGDVTSQDLPLKATPRTNYALNFEVNGTDGNDSLSAGVGEDTVSGGMGDDSLNGLAGSDLMYGGADADTLAGVTGLDTLFGGAGADWLWGGQDRDFLYGDNGDDYLSGDDGDDLLYGGEGHDRFFGSSGNDVIFGEAGDDSLNGSDQNDKLFGGDGLDTLEGGTGTDNLDGGAGNDTVIGGTGTDILRGGIGRDSFRFLSTLDMTTNVKSTDVILDFARGQDKIDLFAIDANAATTNSNDAFLFRGKAAFGSSSSGEVRFQQFDLAGKSKDYTLIYIDTDADRAAEGVIKVMGLHNFTAGDFIL